MLAERLRLLAPVVEVALMRGVLPEGGIEVPAADQQSLVFRNYVAEVIVEGMLHGRAEVEYLWRQGQRRAGFAATVTADPVVPDSAVGYLQQRTILLGKWNRDLDAAVNQVVVNGIQTGATTREIMDVLKRDIFPSFSTGRLENIARTESTTAFNQGRLDSFRQSKGFVAAVQFVAVHDDRTTDICRARDGLILMLDDARLAASTPPLHFMCRSLWSPVTKFHLARLQSGDPATLNRTFLWTHKDRDGLPAAPKTLDEAMEGWDDEKMPPALPGFGEVKPATKAPVKSKPAQKPAPKREPGKPGPQEPQTKEAPPAPRPAQEQAPKPGPAAETPKAEAVPGSPPTDGQPSSKTEGDSRRSQNSPRMPRSKRRLRFPEGISPTPAQPVEIDPLQVNRLHERFEDWRSRGRAREDLDREDIEYLAQYVLSEPAEPKTWDWLMRWADSGHIVGYGVLRHETKEIQYLLDHGINPLDPVRVEETRPIWDRGHALGLTAEAILHVRTAFSKGVEFSLGDAILANPAGDGYVDLSYVEEYTNKKERQKFSLATTDQGRIWAYQYFGVGDEE